MILHTILNTLVDGDFSKLEKHCRLCLKNITDHIAIESDICEKIITILGVQVLADDLLPQKICDFCKNLLNTFHIFRLQCQETNSALLQYVEQLNKREECLNSVFIKEESASEHYVDIPTACEITSNDDVEKQSVSICDKSVENTVTNIETQSSVAKHRTRAQRIRRCVNNNNSEKENSICGNTIKANQYFGEDSDKHTLISEECNGSQCIDRCQDFSDKEKIVDNSDDPASATDIKDVVVKEETTLSEREFIMHVPGIKKSRSKRKYIKKIGAKPRGLWSEEQLVEAAQQVLNGKMKKNEASRHFGIPSRTLRRRISMGYFKKIGLGPYGTFTSTNEEKFISHIKRLDAMGCAPTKTQLRKLAYQFAETYNINHKFSKKKEIAGKDWLQTFLGKHKDLPVHPKRKIMGRDQNKCDHYFYRVLDVMNENDMHGKPQNIFTMDEADILCAHDVNTSQTSCDSVNVDGMTECNVHLIACSNASGTFLPPTFIFKKLYEIEEYLQYLPNGSQVFLDMENSRINYTIFVKWFTEQFVPSKPPGKSLLILNPNLIHLNSLDIVQLADKHDTILVCFDSHLPQNCRPLSHPFFSSFKMEFHRLVSDLMKNNNVNTISCFEMARIIGNVWEKTACEKEAISGFKSSGIYPFDTSVAVSYISCASRHIYTAISSNTCDSSDSGSVSTCTTKRLADSTNSVIQNKRKK